MVKDWTINGKSHKTECGDWISKDLCEADRKANFLAREEKRKNIQDGEEDQELTYLIIFYSNAQGYAGLTSHKFALTRALCANASSFSIQHNSVALARCKYSAVIQSVVLSLAQFFEKDQGSIEDEQRAPRQAMRANYHTMRARPIARRAQHFWYAMGANRIEQADNKLHQRSWCGRYGLCAHGNRRSMHKHLVVW